MVNLPVVEEVKTSCVCWSETLKEGSKVTRGNDKVSVVYALKCIYARKCLS